MIRKLVSLFLRTARHQPPPLRGRPQIRREKTYAADSGYVYHYTYEGYRSASRHGSEGCDFVFHCTGDRARGFAITVFAPDQSFAAWEAAEERDLNAVERYAIVKMRLFEIFDRSEHLSADLVSGLTANQVGRQAEVLDL